MVANIYVFDETTHVYDYLTERVLPREVVAQPLWVATIIMPPTAQYPWESTTSYGAFRAPDATSALAHAREASPHGATVSVARYIP